MPLYDLTNRVCNSVLPDKDVDGFTGASLGKLVQVLSYFYPVNNGMAYTKLYDSP